MDTENNQYPYYSDEELLVKRSVRAKLEEMPPQAREELWQRILRSNALVSRATRIRRIRLRVAVAAAAAVLLVVVGMNFFLRQQQQRIDRALYALSQSEPTVGGSEVQLITAERAIAVTGDTASIRYDKQGSVTVNSQKLEQRAVEQREELRFDQLVVPNGKRSMLALEDGTRLWVNAGTRVIYPDKFGKTKREIYVDGEVYLEVAHEPNRPFIVKTEQIEVEVLGTAFNVNAYKKDSQSAVVLASGRVRVGTKDEKVKITPNEMYSYNPQGGATVRTVNVSDYTSWKEGLYIYHSEPLSSILNRIARYYGENISYDPDIARFTCSGKLNLQDNLDSLLVGLTYTTPVRFVKRSSGEYVFEKIKN
jgi:ferric-dicitrate binding protein FerR (iron transport regulator)